MTIIIDHMNVALSAFISNDLKSQNEEFANKNLDEGHQSSETSNLNVVSEYLSNEKKKEIKLF